MRIGTTAHKRLLCWLCVSTAIATTATLAVANRTRILEEYYTYILMRSHYSQAQDRERLESISTVLSEIGTLRSLPALIRSNMQPEVGGYGFVDSSALDAACCICKREGAAALPLILDLWHSKNVYVRQGAVFLLGAVGPPAVPYLRQFLHDRRARIRVYALNCIGRIGVSARDSVDDVVQMLSLTEEDVEDRFQTNPQEIFEAAARALMEMDIMPDKAMCILSSRGKIGTVNKNEVAEWVYNHFIEQAIPKPHRH